MCAITPAASVAAGLRSDGGVEHPPRREPQRLSGRTGGRRLLGARAMGAWTLVVDAAQTAGAAGAMHGAAFNCVSETACSYVLLNNNGYVEMFRQTGSARTVWLELQQWPHVRRGSVTNRVQLSAAAGSVEVRVNDELLLRVPALPGGLVGLAVHARATAQSVTYALAELRTEQ